MRSFFCHSLLIGAAIFVFNSCATTEKSRQPSSVAQCPSATAAFEDLRSKYDSCLRYGGSSCNDFCSTAEALPPVSSPGYAPAPTPVPPPVPEPVCGDGGRRLPLTSQERLDLDIEVRAYGSVTAHGRNERACVENALGSTTADNLEDSCDAKAVCIKNCSADVDGRPSFGNVIPATEKVEEEVKQKHCNPLQPGNFDNCKAQCAAKLEGAKNRAAQRCANGRIGVSSCTPEYIGEINYKIEGKDTECWAQVRSVPDNVDVSCRVDIKAKNEREYRGRRRGR